MKKVFLFFLMACWSSTAYGQLLNPTIIQQDTDILLQNTDVYYCPFAPPAPTDWRDSLSCVVSVFADPNGTGNPYIYTPRTHDSILWSLHPCSSWPDTLGPFVTWQRFFTANRKLNGTPSDIIAGGIDTIKDTDIHMIWPLPPDTVIVTTLFRPHVTVSANEDVDFRASGRIKLKSGFHVKPGAFFHAYTEPKFDTLVFSDEFDSSHLDRNKWYVSAGNGDVEGSYQCSSDSDAITVVDSDAHDLHALDIDLREMLPGDPYACDLLRANVRAGCLPTIDSSIADMPTIKHFQFATSNITSCPMPFLAEDSPWTPFYQHGPYGKYEIREKIPHILHHTNDWGWNAFEWDFGETVSAADSMKKREIGFVIHRRHGPFKGKFDTLTISGHVEHVFRSSEANFSYVNNPNTIYIDNFPYSVLCYISPTDTFLRVDGNSTTPFFPNSLLGRTVSFNYQRLGNNTADTLTWTASRYGTDTVWKIFSAAYHDSLGHLKYFSKDYQPSSVTITSGFGPPKTYTCYWRADLNGTGTGGILWLNDGLNSSDLNTNTEPYTYTVTEDYQPPTPQVAFDGNDTTGGFVYHTYTMELLPHEMRYLIDGNVVRRFPDRLIPRSNYNYDVISNVPRGTTTFQPAEYGIHQSTYTYTDSTGTHTYNDSLGTHPGTATYIDRQYFEHINSMPDSTKKKLGLWDVEIPPGSAKWYPAAHHLIDYVKIWDVPKDVKIPNFPQ